MRKPGGVASVGTADIVHGGYADGGAYPVGYHGAYQRSLKLPQTNWMQTGMPITTITPVAM